MSAAARIPEDTTAASSHAFEELTLEIAILELGFLYIYVSNENEEPVSAYFDDLSTEHMLSPMTFFSLPKGSKCFKIWESGFRCDVVGYLWC